MGFGPEPASDPDHLTRSMRETPAPPDENTPTIAASALADHDATRRDELNGMLLRVALGDQEAFALLYQRTCARLFGLCQSMLHDHGAAEDVLQEVYATVWRLAATYEPARASAMTWLIAMARNRTIDRLRSRHDDQLDDVAALSLTDDNPSPAVVAERSQERERLERCLDALPPQQKHAVREAFYSGATYAELAHRLSVPLGTMKSWIRRSLVQLKACLEQ